MHATELTGVVADHITACYVQGHRGHHGHVRR